MIIKFGRIRSGWEYCKKCICVEKPQDDTVVKNETEPVNDTKPVAKEVTTEEKKEVEEKIEKKYPDKNITPVEIGNVTDFTEDPAIKATSGITKFFKGIWDWIVGLFS